MIKNYDALIFDIDGTLWNACESTAHAWTETFAAYGIPLRVTRRDIESVAGRPYLECLRRIFPGYDGFDKKDQLLETLARAEKAAMLDLGGTLYPGVLDGLKKLSERYKLYLVSNCQDWYLESFLKKINSSEEKLFQDWTCFGMTQKNKAENLRQIIQRNKMRQPVYIGDTSGDQKSSAEAGIEFIYVSYGFEALMHPISYSSFDELIAALI